LRSDNLCIYKGTAPAAVKGSGFLGYKEGGIRENVRKRDKGLKDWWRPILRIPLQTVGTRLRSRRPVLPSSSSLRKRIRKEGTKKVVFSQKGKWVHSHRDALRFKLNHYHSQGGGGRTGDEQGIPYNPRKEVDHRSAKKNLGTPQKGEKGG